jgi:hypothetical protein
VLVVLALLDFIADKIPAVDHALHLVGLLIHPVAGAILFLGGSSDIGSVHPVLAAVCGLILGGATHAARMTARPAATVTTAGTANPVVSSLEDVFSLVLSVLAILVPVVATLLILFLAGWLYLLFRRWRRRRRSAAPGPSAGP